MTLPTRRALLLAALLAPLPALAQGTPATVIEAFHATLLAVMKDARRLGVQGRAQRLRPAMEQAFNLEAMTRISIGPPWTQMPAADRQALVAAFSDWSIATFAHRFDGFSGESFRLEGENSLQSGDRLVRTQLVRPSDEPVALNYLMRESGGAWRVVDVYLAGTVSELASRRAEFTGLLREGGAARLQAELRRRTEALLRG